MLNDDVPAQKYIGAASYSKAAFAAAMKANDVDLSLVQRRQELQWVRIFAKQSIEIIQRECHADKLQ